jgi:hypothetical protein
MPVQTQMQVRRGTASSWTSTNPTLAAGELGFETDTGKFKIGTGSSTWTALPYAGGGQNTLTTYQYTATAGQTTFSGADVNSNTLAYTAGAVQVYLNGALLANTTDYAASTGTSVVLTAGAGLGDSITILSLGSFTVSTDIPKSTLTAKGSIVAASGAATPANLSVGANDTILTADSTTATGLKWAAPVASGKNFTLLGTGTTTSGSTVTVSGISGQDQIMVLLNAVGDSGPYSEFTIQVNTDSATNYDNYRVVVNGPPTYASTFLQSESAPAATSIRVSQESGDAASKVSGYVTLFGCNSAGKKMYMNAATGSAPSTGHSHVAYIGGGVWNNTGTVTSISLLTNGSGFNAGSFLVYGSA